jgi:hypothetical protein
MAARVLPTFDPPLTSATPATDINPMNTTTTVTFQAQPPAYQAPAQRRQKRRHRQQRQHARRSRALPGVMENHMATMAVEEENVEQEPQAKRSHRLPEPVKSVSSLGLWSKDVRQCIVLTKHNADIQSPCVERHSSFHPSHSAL